MKRLIIIFLLIFPLALLPEDLRLTDAVKRALEVDHGLAAGRYEVERLKLQKKEATSQYLPRLNFKATYTHLDNPIDLELDNLRNLIIQLETGGQLADINLQTLIKRGTPLTDAEKNVYTSQITQKLDSMIPSFDLHVLDSDLFRASIEFSMPIWMGGKVQALNKAAGLNLKEGRVNYTITEEQTRAEVIQVYLLNKLLEEVLNVYKEAETGIEGHYKRAESLYQAGLVAQYQLLRAKVALSDARANREKGEENLKTARSILANLLNRDNLDGVTLVTPLNYIKITEDQNKTWAFIREHNSTLDKLGIKKELVEIKRKADLGDYLPQVYAFGKYELLRKDLSLLDPKWAIGVGVNLNLFSGGEKIFKLKGDRQLYREVSEKTSEVESMLKKLTDKLYFSAASELHTIESIETRLEEAQENLRLAESRFSSGLGISLEVVDAHLMLLKIKTERFQAIYNYTTNWLKLNELAQNLEKSVNMLEEKK